MLRSITFDADDDAVDAVDAEEVEEGNADNGARSFRFVDDVDAFT